MPSTYLPLRESQLDAWLANFAGQIAAAPTKYALTVADAAEISAAVSAWHAAFLVASAPESRTRPSVLAKNIARRAALRSMRRFAALIRAAPADSISSTLKLGLGLHAGAPAAGGTPIAAPEGTPALFLSGMAQGSHTLRVGHLKSIGKGGKPRDTVGLMLYRSIAEGAMNRPEGSEFLSMVTRGRCVSQFTAADRGKIATYFGRWINAKGQVGPWSHATSASIAA